MAEKHNPMNWRIAAIFAFGLLLGGGVAAWAVMRMIAPATPADPAPTAQVVKVKAAPAKPVPTPAASQAHVACPVGQAIASASRDDGHARLQGEPKTSSEIAALILSGKESAAAGRPRDAEVTFLWACQAADKLQRADATEPVDARYQLARHYAHVVAVSDATLPNRAELIRRADLLFADSVQAYRTRYGESHEKTRFAAEGLATLRQSFAQATPAVPVNVAPAQVAAPRSAPAPAPALASAPAPTTAPRAIVAAQPPAPLQSRVAPAAMPKRQPAFAAAAPAPRPPRVELATAHVPVRQATGTATQGRPSFDCALARSPAEKRICADAELSWLDRDLGRLHARAKNSAADGAAFRRQNDREWRRRESTCGGDRECLLDWYADRREQLLGGLDGLQ